MKNELNAHQHAQLSALFQQKRYKDAAHFAKDLTLQLPDCAEVWKALAAALQFQGKIPEALKALQKAVSLSPQDAELHNNLGNTFADYGDFETAENHYQQAIALNSNHPFFHANLARLYQQINRLDDAKKQLQRALEINPYYSQVRVELADIYLSLDEFHEAIFHYEKAISFNPLNAAFHNKLGTAFRKFGRVKQAVFHYRRATEISPEYAQAYSNLGNLFQKIQRLDEAENCLKKALELRPDVIEIYNDLGNVMIEMGRLEAAQEWVSQALRQNPDCLKTYSHFLFIANHNSTNPPQFCFDYAKHFGELAAQTVEQIFSHEAKMHEVKSRLRIGVVSGDFCEHPVSYFLELLFKELGMGEFELFAYPTTLKQDDITLRFQTYFSHWKPIANLNDQAAATLIYDDNIHILLDLAGHTAKNRLPVFAWKPAPIQISWLGYPATTGLKEMDFYLVDADWCPVGMMDNLFVEKILRLPTTAGTFHIPADIPPITDAPCVKNGYLTFGSFNHPAKINRETFDLWCGVLKAIPDAKMILGNVSDEHLKQRLQREFETRDITMQRLIFYPRMPMKNYYALHGEVDLILDTFPYAGGTTSVFAMLMGVPVLTLVGQTLASRVGVTILSCAGIENDFVAHSETEFIAIAKYWHENIDNLQTLRHELRHRMQNNLKCKPDNVARELENTFNILWTQFCTSAPSNI